MKVNLGGIISISTIDWHKKLCSVVFLNGCNMKCWYCHNKSLLKNVNVVEVEKVVDELKGYLPFVDAIVISGGEPTLQEGLKSLCEEIKEFEFPIGIQTNGSKPEVLRELVDGGLVDKIFLDFKTTSGRYKRLTGIEVDPVLESLLIENVDMEIRTTAFRCMEIPNMGWLDKETVLQQGNYYRKRAYDRKELIEIAKEKGYKAIRTKEKGQEKVCFG